MLVGGQNIAVVDGHQLGHGHARRSQLDKHVIRIPILVESANIEHADSVRLREIKAGSADVLCRAVMLLKPLQSQSWRKKTFP